MRIYTRSGDKGTTSLVYGERVSKSDLRVEAYGTCDEANSFIGLAISTLMDEKWENKDEFIQQLQRVQTVLFHVGSVLSTPQNREVAWKLTEAHILDLEHQIDEWDKQLKPLTQFILPSGHQAASTLHVARTVVRRAERVTVRIQDKEDSSLVIPYLNRLSDYLFVAARYVNDQFRRQELPFRMT